MRQVIVKAKARRFSENQDNFIKCLNGYGVIEWFANRATAWCVAPSVPDTIVSHSITSENAPRGVSLLEIGKSPLQLRQPQIRKNNILMCEN